MVTCLGITQKGLPCRFPARVGTSYCINHEYGAERSAAATRASQAAVVARARRGPSEHLLEAVLSFTDRASIQTVLDTLVRLTLSGRISESRARVVLRACAVAARNFDPAGDTLAGPKPQQHDWYPYFEKLNAFLHTVDPLLEQADATDLESLDDLA